MRRSEFWARLDLNPLKKRKPSALTEDFLKTSNSALTDSNNNIKPAKESMHHEH